MTLGTRIAVMRDGVLEQRAPALDVFQRPANPFVATFVRSPAMNLWPCTLMRDGDGIHLVSPTLSMKVSHGALADADGSEVMVGIRPHDIDVVPADGDASAAVEIVDRSARSR